MPDRISSQLSTNLALQHLIHHYAVHGIMVPLLPLEKAYKESYLCKEILSVAPILESVHSLRNDSKRDTSATDRKFCRFSIFLKLTTLPHTPRIYRLFMQAEGKVCKESYFLLGDSSARPLGLLKMTGRNVMCAQNDGRWALFCSCGMTVTEVPRAVILSGAHRKPSAFC